MDFSKLKLFSMMQTKMSYLTERQSVLSQNIANADTPGYRPQDLKKLDFENLVNIESQRLRMRATSTTHLQPQREPQAFRVEKQDVTYEQSPTKNKVNVEEQMMSVAQTKMDYQMTTTMYKKMTDMFKTSLGEN